MEDKPKYIIITPFFPTKERHIGSYVFDQAEAIKNSGITNDNTNRRRWRK